MVCFAGTTKDLQLAIVQCSRSTRREEVPNSATIFQSLHHTPCLWPLYLLALEADEMGEEPWSAPAALALMMPPTSCTIWVGEGRCLRQYLLPRLCKHCSPPCPPCQFHSNRGPALVIPPLLTFTSRVTLPLPPPIDEAPDSRHVLGHHSNHHMGCSHDLEHDQE